MYPTQNYQCYPNPYLTPQVNAVKIDINNPQAYGGMNSQGQMNPTMPAMPQLPAMSPYNYPYNPVYNMPTVPQYTAPAAYPQPPMMVNAPMMPAAVATSSSAASTAVAPTVVQTPAPVAAPAATTAATSTATSTTTVAPAPVIVQTPVVAPTTTSTTTSSTTTAPAPVVIPAPVPVVAPVAPAATAAAAATVAAPVVVPMATTVPVIPAVPAAAPIINNNPAPVVAAPVVQTIQTPPVVPAAIVDASASAAVTPVAPVAAQAVAESNVDVQGMLNGLKSTDADTQTAAIQQIAEAAQTNPAASKALLNEQVFGQLVNVINADTSKLQGPTGEPDPANLSPLEKAEINKQFAICTLAILQKNFRDEINKEMKKNNLPDIAINDLPYIKEGIVNNLKDNPNPTLRVTCLSALNYVGRPEDKQVLKTLYEISAQHDANSEVQKKAKEYLGNIDNPGQVTA